MEMVLDNIVGLKLLCSWCTREHQLIWSLSSNVFWSRVVKARGLWAIKGSRREA